MSQVDWKPAPSISTQRGPQRKQRQPRAKRAGTVPLHSPAHSPGAWWHCATLSDWDPPPSRPRPLPLPQSHRVWALPPATTQAMPGHQTPTRHHLPPTAPWGHPRKTRHSPHAATHTRMHADRPCIPASPRLSHSSSPPPDLGEALPSPGQSPPPQTKPTWDLPSPTQQVPKMPEDKLVGSWLTSSPRPFPGHEQPPTTHAPTGLSSLKGAPTALDLAHHPPDICHTIYWPFNGGTRRDCACHLAKHRAAT